MSIAPAPVAGLYAVALDDGTILYATEDGQHLLAGDLYEISASGLRNRSEDVRSVRRLSLLEAVPEADMIIFPAKGNALGWSTSSRMWTAGFARSCIRKCRR